MKKGFGKWLKDGLVNDWKNGSFKYVYVPLPFMVIALAVRSIGLYVALMIPVMLLITAHSCYENQERTVM